MFDQSARRPAAEASRPRGIHGLTNATVCKSGGGSPMGERGLTRRLKALYRLVRRRVYENLSLFPCLGVQCLGRAPCRGSCPPRPGHRGWIGRFGNGRFFNKACACVSRRGLTGGGDNRPTKPEISIKPFPARVENNGWPRGPHPPSAGQSYTSPVARVTTGSRRSLGHHAAKGRPKSFRLYRTGAGGNPRSGAGNQTFAGKSVTSGLVHPAFIRVNCVGSGPCMGIWSVPPSPAEPLRPPDQQPPPSGGNQGSNRCR